MNGEVCCILGVCCPQGSTEQRDALATELVKDAVCSEHDEAKNVAAWVLKHFDLAPPGSLSVFKGEIARLVRHQTGHA